MDTTISGYEITRRKGLSHWNQTLEEWLLLVQRYSRIMDGEDAAYLYNERANVGVFSGAAWRAGRIALEEFTHQKTDGLGRADLYLADSEEEDLVEAKFKHISLRSRDISTQIQSVNDRSAEAARQSRHEVGELRAVGLSFFNMYLPQKFESEMPDLIDNTISQLKKNRYHAMAWCFPQEARRSRSEKGNFQPGVILTATNIDYI